MRLPGKKMYAGPQLNSCVSQKFKESDIPVQVCTAEDLKALAESVWYACLRSHYSNSGKLLFDEANGIYRTGTFKDFWNQEGGDAD